ncbi:MAG TPA: FecR domain-containing protein [Chitinophagaceae bacterium]|nr:FecR domain-containing protein [Chitinophagaceae bacterium]
MALQYNQPEDFASDDSFVNYCFQHNDEDVISWQKWLETHPGKKEVAEKAREMVFMMSIKLSPEKKHQQWDKIKLNTGQEPDIREQGRPGKDVRRRKAWLFAGVPVLAVLCMMAVYWSTGKQNRTDKITDAQPKSYLTTPGQHHAIVLSDGTHVWLNADSKLTCAGNFGDGNKRVVTLTGEAYFEVAPDAERPFIIHANAMNIKVLGTVFNVKAYPEDKTIEAALIKGSIEVSLRQDPTRKIILRPHEKITIFNGDAHLKNMPASKKTPAPDENGTDAFTVAPLHSDPLLDSGTVETAWMEGKLVFRNEPFDQLAQQMERKYNVHFHFAADQLKNYRFTGIFSTETVDQALHALQLTTPSDPFTYRVDGKKVFITRGKKSSGHPGQSD